MKALTAFSRKLFQRTPAFFFDIGSTNTRVISRKRLVYFEPSCFALHRGTGAVAAIGNKAYALLGKTSPALEVIFPVQQGNWISLEYAEEYLRALARALEIPFSFSQSIVGLQGKTVVPATCTPLHSALHTQALRRSGLHRFERVLRPNALYMQRRNSKADSEAVAILDIGGHTTEASVLVGGEIVRTALFSWGGVRLTEQVQQLVRSEFACALGWQAAEEVKRQLVRMYAGLNKSQSEKWRQTKLAVRGKDVVTQTAKTIVLSGEQFATLGDAAYTELLELLSDFFSEVPTELNATVLTQGICLSGGGSQIKGLAEALEKTFSCAVHVVSRPELDAVEGIAQCMD